MSEYHISEDTMASIVDAAQHIAIDSTAMRQSMIRIADTLQATIQEAGIDFADCSWDDGDDDGHGKQYYYRLAIVKIAERHLVIEEDFSQNTAISIDEARARDGTRYISFAEASRSDLEEALSRLPGFLTAYAEELKRRHKKYAELREMAERIANDIQEMN